MADTVEKLADNAFREHFGSSPTQIVKAPGRVNLIGEHTDYSEGFVMPVAIDLGIAIAFRRREDRLVHVYSTDFGLGEIDLDDFSKGEAGWQEYIKGIAWVYQQEGIELSGWDGATAGNVPIGAGLSSSAAFEVALARVFSITSNFEKTPTELAVAGQMAENQWVGVNVGIMDQLISAAGKSGHAVQIDCRTLEYEYVPIPDGITFVVLDTATRRKLTGSAYNQRRAECEQASEILGVPFLRDATQEMLQAKKDEMPPVVYRRARHVIGENARVQAFNTAMNTGDLNEIGRLINESHRSLDEDYKVSSPELNAIVEIAQTQPGCYGARMTGAGFGGCALAVVETGNVDDFSNTVHSRYLQAVAIEPHIFPVQSADGVRVMEPS